MLICLRPSAKVLKYTVSLGSFELVVDRFPAGLRWSSESNIAGDGRTQVVDKFRHGRLEADALSGGGRRMANRLVRSLEIVDVDPIVRKGFPCGLALQKPSDGLVKRPECAEPIAKMLKPSCWLRAPNEIADSARSCPTSS